jgi:cell division protein FtsL
MLTHSAYFTTQPSYSARASVLSFGAFSTARVRIALLLCVAALGGSYLWLVNSSTSAGFELSTLEKHRVALENEYKDLQQKEVALRSLDHVQAESASMQMVAQTTPTYVDRADHAVALRQ